MDYLNRLNQNQVAAVRWDAGPLLVLAGPGSGKTTTLTARVARLIEDSDGESFRILCLTFTRKAAAEMRERLLNLVPDARNRVLLTTFHSFATDILRQHGSHFGLTPEFEILEDAERICLVKSVLTKRENELTRFISTEKTIAAIDYLLRNVAPDVRVPSMLKDAEVGRQLQILFSSYKELLRQQNCLDYGTILYFCEELLRDRPRVAKQLQTVYRYICVDEFQDTNTAQYKILRAIAPEKDSNLFIVGDDDQIIYQWNGASPTRVRELESDYNLTTIQLPENYRCPQQVVILANALIMHNRDRVTGKQLLLSKKAKSQNDPITLISFEDEDNEAEWVADQIAARIRSGVPARDIVVLARNTKLLDRVQKQLTAVSVLAHIQRRKSQFESAPLRFIIAALKLAVVHTDDQLASVVTKALSDCVRTDISADELAAFAAQSNGDQLEALGLLIKANPLLPKNLQDAIGSLVKCRFAKFIQTAFAYFDLIEEKVINSEGSEQFAEYSTERQVWRSIIREMGGESDVYEMSLGHFLQELALANKTPEAPSNAVRCLTIHGSKGMEFRHIYLIGMAEDQLPSFQSKKAGDDSREIQEERRNCFVAITRTIETLTLTYAQRYNGWKKAPSRFLAEMDLVLDVAQPAAGQIKNQVAYPL